MTVTGTGLAKSLPRRLYLRVLNLRRSLSFKYFVTLFVAVRRFAGHASIAQANLLRPDAR